VKKLLWLLLGIPAAVVLIVFSVANRHPVTMRLDPFHAENPALAIQLPFFVFLFAAIIAGMVIGGLTVWISQSRFRKAARQEKARADALSRQQPAISPRLPAPGGQSRAA
jgi:uncharacterized integral membrane protein